MPACASVANSDSTCGRRASSAGSADGGAVAEGRERGAGGDGAAVGAAQVAQRHDVAVALVAVHRRAQDQGPVGVGRRVGVELGPDRVPLPGLGVDDDGRLVGVGVPRDVGDRARAAWRRRPPAVSRPGTLVTTRLPGEKPSLRLKLGRVDRYAGDVARHRGRVEVEPPAGAVVASATVKKSFGHGSRQCAGSSGSQGPTAAATGSGAEVSAASAATGAVRARASSPARTMRRKVTQRTSPDTDGFLLDCAVGVSPSPRR